MRWSPTRAPAPEVVERLFRVMVRIRLTEKVTESWWRAGRISGELHQSVGEEAVAAGVVDHLDDRDALCVDHRSTGPFIARGVELSELLLELLGADGGLCRGHGGHMHLMSRDHLAVADGIVGASGPLACGFAIGTQQLRPGGVAVAFFGEGASNQGMMLEAWNLAVAWRLPVLFVCKDSGWAITTRSRDVTGGRLDRRAASFGLSTATANGADVVAVWRRAGALLDRVRRGRPAFLHVRVTRPQGHLIDDPFLRLIDEPMGQAVEVGPALLRSVSSGPVGLAPRMLGLLELTRRVTLLGAGRLRRDDPLARAASAIGGARARSVVEELRRELADTVSRVEVAA